MDSILTVLCLCTSLFRVLYKEYKHTRDLTRTWVALNSSQSTIVLHYGIFPYDHHLTNHSYGLDDSLQPLHNWKCEQGGLIKVSCPRASLALDHPVAVESPCWTIFQQDVFCFVALNISLCMSRILGSLCSTVYLQNNSLWFALQTCSCYLVWTILLYWWWSSKLASWSDWKQWLLQVSSLWKLYGCH